MAHGGKAKVFDSDDQAEEGTFKEVGTFEGTQTWESFGSTAISGDGNIIAIGAKDYSGAMVRIGRVLLYRYSSSSEQWQQLGSQIEGSSIQNQRFGRVLALSQDGSRIIVGSGRGFPEVWQLNESQQEWESGGEIKPLGGVGKTSRPGQSVDISNDGKTVVFSADLYNNKAGIAFLYEEDPEESCKWNKIQTFEGLGGPNEAFGSDVALAGDKKMLLVGAKGSEEKAGYSVLFKKLADSPEPTSAPTPTISSSEILVRVMTDSNPGDISWILQSSDGEVLQTLEPGTYDVANHLYIHEIEHQFDTLNAPISFSIFDVGGDGVCCANGNGYYEVYKDNELITSGGEYEVVDVSYTEYQEMTIYISV